ncbi:universal stress protein [Methanogenium organophilum]|uniref:Universal stress protein n=1 Tax=Methanogenium organophilum TaxID=2199 RepID=A0A9X9T6H0_METOG|nr:universal stress protein [Methanogenium organophilum]WAI00383.1 universal stress protein [Methanogenium organophilum]
MVFKTLLVAYDGSEFSREALRTAVANAPLWDAKVHTIYVVNPRYYASTIVDPQIGVVEPRSEHWLQMLEREAEEMLEEAKEIAAAAEIEIIPHMVIGDPRDEILETAKEIGADLIILGSAGKGMTKRFLLGSVSTSVVTQSPIATLVVHTHDEK